MKNAMGSDKCFLWTRIVGAALAEIMAGEFVK